MKKIKTISLIICLAATCGIHAQTPAAMQLADRIARKMKDTLNLTSQQQTQIYNINLKLNDLKMKVRQQYTNRDSLTVKLQRIERGRDSLYHLVLSDTKYNFYLQKKINLISAN